MTIRMLCSYASILRCDCVGVEVRSEGLFVTAECPHGSQCRLRALDFEGKCGMQMKSAT